MKKNDVLNIQFYQMPKAFFNHPAYMTMRAESKLAYMLIIDLLPLSIKNNWVNENDEVFVKLSRTKLMAALNIKGNQKASLIMKELVEYKLIVNKRMGLTKCNEIYIFHPKGPDCRRSEPKIQEPEPKVQEPEPTIQAPESVQKCAQKKPQQTKLLEASNAYITPPIPIQSLAAQTLRQDMDEIHNLLENQVHMEDLRQKYNPSLVNEVANNIQEMFLNTSTRIGQQDKPMVIMRSVIRKLEMHHIEHVIDQFNEVATTREIFSPQKYIQTLIYNSICEANIKIIGNIKYHFGY